MEPILRALRAERETSPWWTRGTHWKPGIDEPPPASIWDDSDTTCARRRRDLDRAAAHMETIREDTA